VGVESSASQGCVRDLRGGSEDVLILYSRTIVLRRRGKGVVIYLLRYLAYVCTWLEVNVNKNFFKKEV